MIAGVDASVTALGLALPDGTLRTIRPRSGPEDPVRRLHELVDAFAGLLRRHPPRPAVVVVEDYALASKGIRSTIRLAELGGALRLRLFELDIDIVEIVPNQLKRAATGHGNADKPRMVTAARNAGAAPANHDEADAWWLRHLGRVAYGLDPPATPTVVEIVSAHRWPTLPRSPA